jgi:hypothetical protein
MNAEQQRLDECVHAPPGWKKWGPYVGERQWGTVREDYSPDGRAWDYLPHDHARSRAYRWGEDGIAGFCDHEQKLCLTLALWNGRDPILKERLFGLTNSEGNHGEDVKELYYYLDATPTHSYLKMLYKYPHAEYPYADLVAENARRGSAVPEYELLDTGVFDDNRYFDVFVEYAQGGADDVLMRITACNRAGTAAPLHLIPQLVFRNTWAWKPGRARPLLRREQAGVQAEHRGLGILQCHVAGTGLQGPDWLLTENDTNVCRLYGIEAPGPFKDAFHEYVVDGRERSVADREQGTKAGAHFSGVVPAQGSVSLKLRLSRNPPDDPFDGFDQVFALRIAEADEFYGDLQHDIADADVRHVQRQALAGMIWSKQFYYFDIPQWLAGDPGQVPPPPARRHGRNHEWTHLNNADVISMPDKWEYPWYASWDLAFHAQAFALVDPHFAKQQLVLLTREWYMHPNGQIPAYEWAFGDVNPPVHAWATWRVYQMDRNRNGGTPDLAFLERVFHKLMLNFTWWVNRKDAEGHNVFQGGFLGLDNIGVFDRSAELPTGGHIDQADGTSWMAMYSLNLLKIALELALHNPVYEDIATKFFEHFLNIAAAIDSFGDDGAGLWDEADHFFYDVLHLPDGTKRPMRVRSMVGLMPLFAVETLEPELLDRLPHFRRRLEWFLRYRPDLAALVSNWTAPGRGQRRLLSLLRGHRMKQLLARMLDETEFLSPYGIRGISKVHEAHPYVFDVNGLELTVKYLPAESDSRLFGGNSNWRGPVWFPVNYLLIEALQKFHHYYGDDFRIECPTGSGNFMTIAGVAHELATRLARIFLRDSSGRRPVFAQYPRMQDDEHFRDHILFYEYFHGDSGRGVGASHQTGWTGLVAKLLQPRQPPRNPPP